MLSKLIFIIILLFCLYLSSLVYYNNPKGKDNKLFLVTIFWLIFFIIFNYLENERLPENFRIFFLKADFITATIFVYFWFIFCFHFLEQKKIKKYFNCAIILFAGTLVFFIIYNLVIYDIDASSEIIKFKIGSIFPLYILFIFISYLGGLFFLLAKYRRFKGAKKLQTLYVLCGFFLSSIIIIVLDLFFQEKVSIEIFRMGTTGVIFLIAFTSYAIIRHHLFDIRSIIQRGIIYSALLAIIVGFYLIVVFILGYFFQKITNVAMIISAGLITIIGILGFPPLEKYFRRLTDKIFFKDKYDYSKAIYELSEVLNKNINLKMLLAETASKLKSILKVKRVNIILPKQNLIFDEYNKSRKPKEKLPDNFIKITEQGRLSILIHSEIPLLIETAREERDSSDYIKALKQAEHYSHKYKLEVLLPILLEKELIGLVTLGEKLSGEIYTQEDINLLKTLSYQMATALEKSQLFEKVKKYSRELEERVEERTAKIKELQEEQRQMMLEIAHDLQTPLTIIKGELGVLGKKAKDDKKIKTFEKSIDRISKFIYDMMRLFSLEAKDKDFRRETINLSELLQELTESFQIITQEKNIKVVHNIEPGLFILGEKRRLEELVTNLVSNSVKFMSSEREKKIFIQLKRKDGKIELSIEDTGIGISKEHLPHLFERFYVAEDNSQTTGKGTGLGLAICKKIVEKHKGTIKAESKVGQGTKFIIELPIILKN